MHGDVEATYYLNYISTCIFFSLFSRILAIRPLNSSNLQTTLVITTIHIVAIRERNTNSLAPVAASHAASSLSSPSALALVIAAATAVALLAMGSVGAVSEPSI